MDGLLVCDGVGVRGGGTEHKDGVKRGGAREALALGGNGDGCMGRGVKTEIEMTRPEPLP